MTVITCACGKVRLEAEGAPLVSAICHCTSCRTAGQAFDAVSGQPPVVDRGGGVALVLWPRNRMRCVAGDDLLESHRLTPGSPTRRLVARCCNSPVLTDFTKGFWISVYRGRVADAPPPRLRMMTGDVPADMSIPDDGVPRKRGQSLGLMLKLIAVWARMGFRNPKVAGLHDG